MRRAVPSSLLLLAALPACLGPAEPEVAQGATLALEWEANPDAVRLIGLFAFPASLEGLNCTDYESGEFDPFVEGEPAGISFFAVQALEEGEQLLDGVTTGNRVILVEGYDAGGTRIFLGCGGPVAIEANRKAHVDITLRPDPSTETN